MADATLRIDVDTREANRALGGLSRSLQALATGAVVSGFIKLSDQATELRNRLNQVSTSTTQQSILFERLVQVANNARTPLSTTGDLFFRIARNVDALGISQAQALTATELVAKAISSSGISAAEASGPLLQLGQALASGRLQGDELRSILEGLPPVAKAIADSLGVPIGELRRLGSEGKISSQQVIQAILSARDVIEKDFGKTVPTIGQGFTTLTNNLIVFVDKLNSASGATSGFAKAINYLAQFINFLGDNIDTVLTIIDILIVVFVTRGLGAIAKGIFALKTEITALGYIFKNFGAGAAGFVGSVVAGFKSLITQVTGAKQAIAGPLDALARLIFLPFAYLLRIAGSFLKNFAVPIGIAIAYISDLLDPLIAKFSVVFEESKRIVNKLTEFVGLGPVFDSAQKSAGKLATDVDKANKEIEKQGKGIQTISDRQRDFNKEFEKNIRQQEYSLQLRTGGVYYNEQELRILEEINQQRENAISKEATLSNAQSARIRALMQEQASYERMAESRRQIEEAGRNVITQAAITADPRISAETEYINQKIALENYFVQNSLLTQEQYQQTLFQIEEQYRLAKYDASVALEERLRSIQQKTFEEQLRNQGFSFDQARRMSEERAAFDRKTEFEKAQYAIEQGASVFESLGKYNKTAFQAAKAFNIANAIMNTYAGATKALATYPPPFNFIAAAAVVAGGMAQVAQIRAQQYSGRALGGPVMAGQSYIVGERGPEMFTPATSGGITPNNQLSDGSPVNINFNIQANDARGFDQLLAERRPMIINMVRTAMEDRGNKSNL